MRGRSAIILLLTVALTTAAPATSAALALPVDAGPLPDVTPDAGPPSWAPSGGEDDPAETGIPDGSGDLIPSEGLPLTGAMLPRLVSIPVVERADPEEPTDNWFFQADGLDAASAGEAPEAQEHLPSASDDAVSTTGGDGVTWSTHEAPAAPPLRAVTDGDRGPDSQGSPMAEPQDLVSAPVDQGAATAELLAVVAGLLILGVPAVLLFSHLKAGLHAASKAAWALFTRIGRHAVLENPNRQTIMDFIEANPGATIQEISQSMDLARSTVRHHVHRLAEHQMAKFVTRFNECRVFPVVQGGDTKLDDHRILLMRSQEQSVAKYLQKHPGAFQRAIGREVGLHPSRVHVILDRLSTLGLVDGRKAGRRIYYYPTDRMTEVI